MLTVTRLKLHNICQYEDIDVPIETGLMAICGRNGSGKSTLLRGLMYGLTGLVDGSWGTQQNLQKDGTATPGYVVVSLKDDQSNKEYTIKRFSTAGTKFPDSVTEFYKGETKEVATRRKTVDAFLGELYGIPCALLFQLCWGRQGQLDMLLTAPAAYVSTFLSGVWNTKYLETLRDRLKGAIDKVAVMADPMKSIEESAKERLGLEQALPGLAEKEKGLQASIEAKGKELEDLQKQVSQSSVEDAKKAAVLNERLSQCGVNINAALQSLNNADLDAVKDKTLEELGEALNVAQKALAEHSTAATQASQAVIAIGNSYQRLSDTLVDLQTKLNDVKTERQRIEGKRRRLPRWPLALLGCLVLISVLAWGADKLLPSFSISVFPPNSSSAPSAPSTSQTILTEPSIPRSPVGSGVTVDLLPPILPPGQQSPMTTTQIYEENLPSTVSVYASGPSGSGNGTGIILTRDGYLLTNAHVISGADLVRVAFHNNQVLCRPLRCRRGP